MMQITANDMLTRIETRLHAEFPSVHIEFATQSFANHLELWIYVLDIDAYESVQTACRHISDDEQLDRYEPEIWLLVKTWTGPWPGGESEQEIKHRRDEFRRRNLVA